ncbi:hypothetical protein QVD17_26623 [Tagetes erecta]|uniref:SANT domain-containing protein n=1 Tax=Tagetes erecta TaxID=13708 RepID=A0AAD8K7Q7_TARER|nr:hypothetical protein QVD17_26623 [Tagetes erecta]
MFHSSHPPSQIGPADPVVHLLVVIDHLLPSSTTCYRRRPPAAVVLLLVAVDLIPSSSSYRLDHQIEVFIFFCLLLKMDFDLDVLLSTDAANAEKPRAKFQPKGKPKPKPKPSARPESKSTQTSSAQLVEVAATTEEHTGNNANQIIGNVLNSLQSYEKSQRENAESVHSMDSPNDSLPESTTTVNLPPCSETPTVDVSLDGILEAGPTEPELINKIDASENLESITALDPLTGEGAAILNNNGDFQIGSLSPGSKEAGNSLFWEPQSITGSGTRAGKFKPKPKAQSRKIEQIANNPDQDVGPIQHGENIHEVPSQSDLMENEPASSFTPDELLGTSSIRVTDTAPTETISDYHVNEEPINMSEISQVDSVNETGRSSQRVKRVTSKALQLIDEAENEGIDDNDNNDDYVPENEALTEKKERKSKRKSKKSLNENKNPVRKRKKGKEVGDELIEAPKKKFSHSTKRKSRQVNPELLKIPEEEFEMQMHNFPLKDLIRLREHKEKIEKKEASLLRTDTTDQSDCAENATYYNYRTHMKITPRMKWTKVDTELFFEAIQQFGTDLSIIKECFPGRTREQIRSKFKKEYKQNRLRIESALNTRAKGLSHFEFVIERLKQAQAEDSENDDPASLTGEEDEEAATDINKSGDSGLQKEVKDLEPDVSAGAGAGAESPIKSDDIEEDDTWSHYKSEI